MYTSSMKKEIKVSIGNNLQRLRTQRRLSLTELSKQSGVQMATLSRIENNKMTGTLESHMAIAKVLDIPLSELYEHSSDPIDIASEIKSAVHVDTSSHTGQAYYEILTKNPTFKKMLPLIIKIEPKGEVEENPVSGAERFLFVLEGEVEILYQNQPYKLKKNQTLYLENLIKYTIKNLKDSPAKIFCVTTPVRL